MLYTYTHVINDRYWLCIGIYVIVYKMLQKCFDQNDQIHMYIAHLTLIIKLSVYIELPERSALGEFSIVDSNSEGSSSNSQTLVPATDNGSTHGFLLNILSIA